MSELHLDGAGVIRDDDFAAFSETVPHMVWRVSNNRMLEWVNSRSADYIGCQAASVGTDWVDLVHPDDVPAALVAWTEANVTGEARDAEFRLRREDGTYRWHAFHALALRDAAGSPQSWIGVATDVENEHRRHDQVRALERSTAEALVLLETLQEHAPIGFGLLDLDLRIVRENQTLARLQGGGVTDHIGHHLCDVIPDRWPAIEPILNSVIAKREPALNQQSSLRLDGESQRVHYLSSSYYPVIVAGDLIGVGVVAADVTERREAEITQRELTLAAVGAIAAAVEVRDPYTAGHQRRVATIASAIAVEIGLDPAEVQVIELAAGIHDIGKLGVPSEILVCPRRLTTPEFELVKTHSQVGYDIVAGIDFRAPIASMVLQHHERLDGSGYPNQLRGDEILLGARIIAVADTVEAMGSHRPYRPARGLGVALDEIRRGRGTIYDPDVADACVRLFSEGRLDLDQLD